ncbi:MAG: hypothetical protein RL634_1285 [Bacteroidota bacterium]|jgi:hypothetical protein
MRIVNFDNEMEFEEIPSLQIVIKAVPFENGFVPSFVIMSPTEEYGISIDELNALMDGIEIAKNKIDEIITHILKTKIFDNNGKDKYDYTNEEFNEQFEVIEDLDEIEIEDEDDE